MTATLEQWRELEALLANATGPSGEVNLLIQCMVAPLSQELDDWSGSIDVALTFADMFEVTVKTLNWHKHGGSSVSADHGEYRFWTLPTTPCSAPLAILRAVVAAKIKEIDQ